MFIQVTPRIICTVCGGVDNYEEVYRKIDNETDIIFKCLKCGHEKIEMVLTANPTTGETMSIPAVVLPAEKYF